MTGLDYAKIPACATILLEEPNKKRVISLPAPDVADDTPATFTSVLTSTPSSPSGSGTKASFTNALLSSTLFLPTLPDTSTFLKDDQGKLLSNREPLSLPTTAVNFRRFVSRSGPVFWLQDRIEEIVMWKKGWKTTCTWMALYSLLCPSAFFLTFLITVVEFSFKASTPDYFFSYQTSSLFPSY